MIIRDLTNFNRRKITQNENHIGFNVIFAIVLILANNKLTKGESTKIMAECIKFLEQLIAEESKRSAAPVEEIKEV